MKAHDNPFAMERIEALLEFEPEWYGTNWPDLLQHWQQLDYRAAIVGPHGSGKTTLLRSLEARLKNERTQVHHFFLNDRQPDLKAHEWQRLQNLDDQATTVILLDGAERLNRRAWRRFHESIVSHNGSVRALVTQHRASRFYTRWPTLLKTNPTPALLAHLIEKLAPDFANSLTKSQIADLLTRHGGNLREAMWECYDSFSAKH
jgi:MoxR-like ATPase